jgi:PD-(D/E)XK nuclease superfamily
VEGGLMPTPLKGYWLDGIKVCSVTEVLGQFKDSGGLIGWTRKMCLAGIDSNLISNQAKTIGTIVHKMVEEKIHGRDPHLINDLDDFAMAVGSKLTMFQLGERSFNSFKRWSGATCYEIKETEIRLISPTYKFGGTIDAVGNVGNQLCLLDWKTSKGIYDDYFVQVAAYAMLWEENFPDRPLLGGYHILRIDKETGDYDHRSYEYGSMEDGQDQFKDLVRCFYRRRDKIKPRVGR